MLPFRDGRHDEKYNDSVREVYAALHVLSLYADVTIWKRYRGKCNLRVVDSRKVVSDRLSGVIIYINTILRFVVKLIIIIHSFEYVITLL